MKKSQFVMLHNEEVIVSDFYGSEYSCDMFVKRRRVVRVVNVI